MSCKYGCKMCRGKVVCKSREEFKAAVGHPLLKWERIVLSSLRLICQESEASQLLGRTAVTHTQRAFYSLLVQGRKVNLIGGGDSGMSMLQKSPFVRHYGQVRGSYMLRGLQIEKAFEYNPMPIGL